MFSVFKDVMIVVAAKVVGYRVCKGMKMLGGHQDKVGYRREEESMYGNVTKECSLGK